MQEIVDGLKAVITQGVKLVQWVIDNKDWLVPMVTAIGGLTIAWNLALGAAKAYAAFAGLGAIGGAAGLGAAGAIGAIGAGAAVGGFMQGQQTFQNAEIYSQSPIFKNIKPAAKTTPPVVIQVKTVNDAKTTLDAIAKFQKSTGTRVNLGQY